MTDHLNVFMVSRTTDLNVLWRDPKILLPPTFRRTLPTLPDAEAAASELQQEKNVDLLLVNFRLPKNNQVGEDESGETAIELLQDLKRARGRPIPAVVLYPDKQELSGSIDEELSPDLKAIALPHGCLIPFFLPFWDIIGGKPSIDMIEIDISATRVTSYLGWQGKRHRWREMKLPKTTVEAISRNIAGYDVLSKPGIWLEDLRRWGSDLFRDLVLKSIGEGLFAHLEATRGLSQLTFRFNIVEEEYFSIPIEASVRWVKADHRFVLRECPLARRIVVVPKRAQPTNPGMAASAKLLFVKSQVAQSTKGDRLKISYVRPDGKRIDIAKTVNYLENVELEYEGLKELEVRRKKESADQPTFVVELLDLAEEKKDKSAAQILRERLSSGYDIVHFAGHSITEEIDKSSTKKTWLVLPGDKPGEAVALPIDEFAELAGMTGVRLVYLSSCRGSSPRTVSQLVSEGVPYSIGFRWNVKDTDAAVLALKFYEALFDKPPATIGSAFRTACHRTSAALDESSPIWLSPILIAQTEDWAVKIAA